MGRTRLGDRSVLPLKNIQTHHFTCKICQYIAADGEDGGGDDDDDDDDEEEEEEEEEDHFYLTYVVKCFIVNISLLTLRDLFEPDNFRTLGS